MNISYPSFNLPHTYSQFTHTPLRLALVPGPVQNLKREVDDKHVSVKLNWDPPLNFKRPGEVTAYRISFQPKGRNQSEMIIDESSTTCLLTRDSGLIASTMHTFAVRAQQNTETLGEWKKVTAYVGRCCDLVTVNGMVILG